MQAGADLAMWKPADPPSPRDQGQYRFERGNYLRRLARLEAMEGKPRMRWPTIRRSFSNYPAASWKPKKWITFGRPSSFT